MTARLPATDAADPLAEVIDHMTRKLIALERRSPALDGQVVVAIDLARPPRRGNFVFRMVPVPMGRELVAGFAPRTAAELDPPPPGYAWVVLAFRDRVRLVLLALRDHEVPCA